jgi:peroxiredoxin Q/BCP
MKTTGKILRVVLLGVVVGAFLAVPANALEVGQKAPDFTLTAPGNKQVKLADLLGKGPVVLYTFVDAFGAA